MSADPNRVSAKRTRRDNGDTSITSTGKVSTRKRKRKGPDNASIVLDDYDSDFSEGTPEDDDIDYIPKGYSISKTVKQSMLRLKKCRCLKCSNAFLRSSFIPG